MSQNGYQILNQISLRYTFNLYKNIIESVAKDMLENIGSKMRRMYLEINNPALYEFLQLSGHLEQHLSTGNSFIVTL